MKGRFRLRMVRWLMLLLPTLLPGAIIRGVVVENLTGKALSRTQVMVQPIGGTSGPTLRVFTNSNGGFEFTSLKAGAFIVTASRKNFAAVQYGQKDFRSAGLAIVLDDVASTFLNFRLPRLGVISGRVVDENDVGLPNHDVVVYRNTHPPQMLQRLPADERGAYRFYGLDPGSYLIRTVAREYDEGSYLPTFAKETTIAEEARPVEVNLDSEVTNIDVRPKLGTLYKIQGVVLPGMMTATGEPVTVKLTMASEMGREVVDTSKNFRFPPVAPGDFELYAEGPGDGSFNCIIVGGYRPLHVTDKDLTDIEMPVPCVRETQVLVTESHGQRINPNAVTLLLRGKDLAGVGEIRTRPLDVSRQDRLALAPGRWEVMLRPPPNYCVVGFSFNAPRSEGAEKGRPDGWNEILAGSGSAALRFVVSSTCGAMHGLISGLSHEPVAGAPVYLEGYDPESRRRVTDLQMALTDARGQYQFKGLAPGSYRVLASFEFQRPDSAAMDYAGAKIVKVQENFDLPQDLDLSVIH